MLSLLAFDSVTNQRPGQQRVFALVFEGSSVTWLAGQVHPAAKGHVVALGAQFPSDQRTVFARGVRIPACSRGDVCRQRRRVAAVLGAHPDPVGRVAHLYLRNTQARYSEDEASSLVPEKGPCNGR